MKVYWIAFAFFFPGVLFGFLQAPRVIVKRVVVSRDNCPTLSHDAEKPIKRTVATAPEAEPEEPAAAPPPAPIHRKLKRKLTQHPPPAPAVEPVEAQVGPASSEPPVLAVPSPKADQSLEPPTIKSISTKD